MMGLVKTALDTPLQPSAIWSTVRFRRAKDKKGWALLGIPTQLYPTVALRLFEQKARLIEQYHGGNGFTSILFEAPSPLAARLASIFPAPPGCEPLKVAATRDRILSGKAANTSTAISQATELVALAS